MLISRAIHIENASFAGFRSMPTASYGGQRKKRKFGQRCSGNSPNLVGLPTSIPSIVANQFEMIKYLQLMVLLSLNFHEVQAQIPNGGFETWDNEFNYAKPTGWWTNQDTIYTRFEKDTNSVEGNYALKIVSSGGSAKQGCESRAITRVNFDSVLTENSVLTLYVKSIPQDIEKDSSVYLLIFGFTFNSDSVIGGFDWRTETPIFEFEKVEIPLSGKNIDEISIFIYGGAGNSPFDGCVNQSISWLDGMTIESDTPVGSSVYQEKNNIIIYPNPSTGIVYITGIDIQNIRYELYTSIGEFVATGKIENGGLSVQNQGVYILKLYALVDDREIYSSKLVIVK
jgi:hypothetical protein